jgi:uncharacterized iron-regulated membrane protein
MPRSWTWRAVRPVIWFRQNESGKSRDFNWHNTIGFWSAPVLIVLTLTAIPISFRWGGDFINMFTGTPPRSDGASQGSTSVVPAVDVPAPVPGAQPLSPDALLAAAQKAVPDWKTITLRTSATGGRGGPSGPGGRGGSEGRGGEDRGAPSAETREGATEGRLASASRVANQETQSFRSPRPGIPTAPLAFTVSVRQQRSWPRTATTTLSLNPYTGEVLRSTGYGDMAAAQQVRSWTRFLHTGEAIGPLGQLIAGLACLGGVFLVYTGFALSWRRFFGQKPKASAVVASSGNTSTAAAR